MLSKFNNNQKFIGYKCDLCKGSKAPIWKRYSKWIDKHFQKYHAKEQIKLKRLYKKND